jgi:tyrosinase
MATIAPVTMRIRRDVWKMSKATLWDPDLLWYAKAVESMKKRPLDDPLGWRYQAAIHEYPRGSDPFADPADTFPTQSDQDDFWDQCQHGSWYFLPWHRMYLLHFERIVEATIVQLGGPANWALPYWNYSDQSNADAMKLPPEFIAGTLPDGTANPLAIPQRAPHQADGDFGLTALEVDIKTCLDEPEFEDSATGTSSGFGGEKTGFVHSGGTPGDLEITPHGDVHSAVGGFGGFMGRFSTAALDPIFWLHHANIDRLWQVWRDRNVKHADPSDTDWLTPVGINFRFHDAQGNVVSHAPKEVADTSVALLSYRYEDVSDPFPAALAAGALVGKGSAVSKVNQPAELVGATTSVSLGAVPVTASIALSTPSGPAALAAGAAPRRVYLNFENVTSEQVTGGYVVYVEPPGVVLTQKGLVAGTLPMFGVVEATSRQSPHGGSGLSYALDITEIVNVLKSKQQWDPNSLRVRVEPIREAPNDSGLKIGRISVFYR